MASTIENVGMTCIHISIRPVSDGGRSVLDAGGTCLTVMAGCFSLRALSVQKGQI